MGRTVTRRSGTAARRSASRPPGSTPSGTATTSIMAKWPRRIVIDVSSRLQPRSKRTAVTPATMPGRSAPTAVTATCDIGLSPAQLVEPVVVDPEVVGDLVHDRDPNLVDHLLLGAATGQ